MQRWRGPVAQRAKSAVLAAIGVAVAVVFLPLWLGLPVAVALTVLGAGTALFGASVMVDRDAGLLVLRSGLIVRRIRLTDVRAVLVDTSKLSIARAGAAEISMYTWRKSRLDGWLGIPAVAGEIGHAIASAVALARDAAGDGAGSRVQTGSSARTRSALAAGLLGCTGAVEVVAALFVRVSWHNPVMSALGVTLALVLGVSGVGYLLVMCWLLLTRQASRPASAQHP